MTTLSPPDPYTEQMCAEDPRAAATRAVLSEQEVALEAMGWDAQGALMVPRLFELAARREAPEDVGFVWDTNLNSAFRTVWEMHDQHLTAAMRTFAETAEELREKRGLPPGAELVHADSSWRYYGSGLAMEAWVVDGNPGNAESVRVAAERRQLDEHPERRETRLLYAVTRDGEVWTITRRRGYPPQPRLRTVDTLDRVGGVLNGLSRLVNVFSGENIPVVPLSSGRTR